MSQISASLSSNESWSLLALSAASLAILAQIFYGDGAPLVASIALSGLAYSMTYSLIRWLGPTFMNAGLKGKDMSKTRKTEIPETMGVVCAGVYFLLIIVFIPFSFYKDIVAATSGGGNRDMMADVQHVETGRFLQRFPHSKLNSYTSAILSLNLVVFLGLLDDLFDIRWRHKFFIPALASIPLLVIYFVDFGVTKMVVPTPLRSYFGDLLDIGWLYYAYMAGISIFCPNSINIIAGINGIEVGQSVVIAILILINDAIFLYPFKFTTSSPSKPHPATDSHLFSVYFLLPFLGVSSALLSQNWYPARIFVGDTYCYFAGMVFAVVAILGHFSKTLLLLLIPQIFNFLYSVPQLFGFIPCPRHRLPHFNARTGLLEPSWAEFLTPLPVPRESPSVNGAPPSNLTTSAPVNTRGTQQRVFSTPIQLALKLLTALHLLKTEMDPTSGKIVRCTNLTILNLWLVWFGPMREDRLAVSILLAQGALGLCGLWVRHSLALLIYTADNL